ncbi:MAG: hypothetical protein ACYC2H_12560 [Thermoplasmatota archaeon]
MTSRGPAVFATAPIAAFVIAHVASSALHFADNALRFGHYHDAATPWLNPTVVVVAWFVQTALGVAGFMLHRGGHRAGKPLLIVYGALGFAGLLHYLVLPDGGLGGWAPDALIGLEAATGLGLLVAMLRDGPRPTPSDDV